MQYFVYGRDRAGASGLKAALTPEHWDFMDRYGDGMVARGPTLTGAGGDVEPTGSLHVVELADAAAARVFAFEEPYYRAGVFESVLVCRFENLSGRTMWDFAGSGLTKFLVIGTGEGALAPNSFEPVIVYGELLDPETALRVGWAAAVEAPDREAALGLLKVDGDLRLEAHPWEFGGRR